MDDKQLHKFIGYAILAAIAYAILQTILPYLIWGLIIVTVWRWCFGDHKPRK